MDVYLRIIWVRKTFTFVGFLLATAILGILFYTSVKLYYTRIQDNNILGQNVTNKRVLDTVDSKISRINAETARRAQEMQQTGY